MKLVFLGTSGMVPTKERNVQGIYLEYKGEGILLDCGEGTQRQMQFAGLNAQKIKKILISHWHGDHVSGLLGLLQTIGNFSAPDKVVQLYGPPGSKQYIEHLKQSCIFDVQLNLEIIEVDPKEGALEIFYENDDYTLSAIHMDHGVTCLGYKFLRKEKRKMNQSKLKELNISGTDVGILQSGKSIEHNGTTISCETVSYVQKAKAISFIFDTKLCDACYALAENSNVVVSEAVYKHELEHKAEQYSHMTATQAAQVASESGVDQLILTHFSQRYPNVQELGEEAKQIFEHTICAYDLLKIDLPF